MNTLSKGSVTWREIDESAHDQRIDNFLHKILKGVPKSHIYRIVRGGEVRVNGRRVEVTYRAETRVPLVGALMGDRTIRATATMRVESPP